MSQTIDCTGTDDQQGLTAQLMQKDCATAVGGAYVRKVHCAVVCSLHCILDMMSFGSADSMRRASMHVDGTTGQVSLSQYFRWKETHSILYFPVISQLTDCSTTLPLEVFTQGNFEADIQKLKLIFFLKNWFLSHPLEDLARLQLVGKPVVNFLFVIIELFSLSLMVKML